MADIDDVADYLILKMAEAGTLPSVHRLNKLLYYVQGWNLAVHGAPMFNEKFQAWVHGPIHRGLFNRLTGRDRCLYTLLEVADVRPGFSFDVLSEQERRLVDEVLESYGMYSGTDLQDMSRSEPAWIKARGDLPRAASSESELDEAVMADFFRGKMAVRP